MSRIRKDLLKEVLNLLIAFNHKPDEKLLKLIDKIKDESDGIILLRNINNDHPLIRNNVDKMSKIPVSVHQYNKDLNKLRHMLKHYSPNCSHSTNVTAYPYPGEQIQEAISSITGVYPQY